jgi:hypothetical protein
MTKHFRVLHADGSLLEVEGEIVAWNGQRALLDGQGRPWLLLADEDIVSEIGMDDDRVEVAAPSLTSSR